MRDRPLLQSRKRLRLSCTFPRFGGTELGTYRSGLGLGRGGVLEGLKAFSVEIRGIGDMGVLILGVLEMGFCFADQRRSGYGEDEKKGFCVLGNKKSGFLLGY